MSTIDDLFRAAEAVELPFESISTALTDMLVDYNNNRPRSLQRELGPSEVGDPCQRRLAYGLMKAPGSNPQFDPLPSFVGTEAHNGYQKAAEFANERLGRTRWLAEMRLTMRPGLSGSCDLIDLDTMTIIDHKFLSQRKVAKIARDPGEKYRRQVHLYGRGARNIGLPIEFVMIHILPRGGINSGKQYFAERYSDEIADETLNRMDETLLILDSLDVDHHPEAYAAIKPTPSDDCRYCPFFNSNPQTPFQCDGSRIGGAA